MQARFHDNVLKQGDMYMKGHMKVMYLKTLNALEQLELACVTNLKS